jgi:hypothetical protein
MKAVDWDCDGVIESSPVSQDLARDSTGHWCASSGAKSALVDFNDWAHLVDNAKTKKPEDLTYLPTHPEVTWEQRQWIVAHDRSFRQPPIQIEPCIAARMLWAVPGNVGLGGGWCSNPFIGFAQVYDNAWEGDVLFLKYGVYDVNAPTVLLTKRMVITATSNALIRPVGKDGD